MKMISGKDIECVSIIGLDVGDEKLMSDESEVMDMLMKEKKGDIKDDDKKN
jgi:hypothetical protein